MGIVRQSNSCFENPLMIAGKQTCNLKKQHFKFGQAAGGSTDNKLLYGSLTNEKRDVYEENHVSKYYARPSQDISSYSKQDYTMLHNNNKLNNVFSLEKRTSAELLKKEKEIKDTGEDRARYRKEKELSEMARIRQKKDEMNLLMSYKEPWGKPGAGAPKADNNNKISMEVQRLSSSREQVLPLGRPGAGAPMRTLSGALKTKRDYDYEIKFQKRERGQVLDIIAPDSKYAKENPLMTNLDFLARKTREERNVVKRDEDSSNYQFYDPFGRPGCGAPTKDNNGKNITTRTCSLGRTVLESDYLKENTKIIKPPKWNAFNKRQYLNMDGERYIDRDKQQRYNEELAEMSRKNTEIRKRDILKERRESLQHADTWNNVFGKPGNGAPLESSRRKRGEIF